MNKGSDRVFYTPTHVYIYIYRTTSTTSIADGQWHFGWHQRKLGMRVNFVAGEARMRVKRNGGWGRRVCFGTERERNEQTAERERERKKENCHAYSKRGFTPVWSVELAGPTEKEKKDARSFSRRATAVTRPFFSIQFFSLSPKIETWIGIANLQISSSLFLYIYIYRFFLRHGRDLI